MSDDRRWVGIDTSTRSLAVCVVDSTGAVVSQEKLSANIPELHNYLQRQTSNIIEVALETGTTSIHPARALRELGYTVAVYHAISVHRFLRAKLNKTDGNDAQGLAEIARVGGSRVQRTYLKSIEMFALRTKLAIRERLIRMRKVNEAAMMSLLHAYGVRAGDRVSSPTSLRKVVMAMIASAEETYDAPVRELVLPLLELSIQLRREELRLENELKAYASKSDVCCRLLDIPGVGIITVISFITAVGEPSRFSRSADVGAYFGLTPRVWSTGAFIRKRGISKIGSNLTRKHLYGAARAALDAKRPSKVQVWAKALALRTNRKKAIIALARKLAVIMLTMWKDGSRFEPSSLEPLQQNSGIS